MKKAIVQILEWALRLVSPAPTPHEVAGAPERTPAPAAQPRLSVSVCAVDPPTLPLPRLPVADRFPIAWDTEPVPLYIVRYDQQRRALEATR
ncbi:hypothetical protein SSOG_05146 [Streptomyces himastatinicus ATCC 53653]|uniref:Uncharacterized protein n=1 Tax=Streptomyces himastatinicus ATCC 53653 TaxID=457427 RepID=D9WGP4_9ACTN|nr:hypothetical protein SSOG_05146 [Streptomyces himastatinicus ATCC 53653]